MMHGSVNVKRFLYFLRSAAVRITLNFVVDSSNPAAKYHDRDFT
jgi:hypothetical protein